MLAREIEPTATILEPEKLLYYKVGKTPFYRTKESTETDLPTFPKIVQKVLKNETFDSYAVFGHNQKGGLST